MKPQHTHDGCEFCKFVATTFADRGVTDWYVHDGMVEQTVIGRWGSEGSQYNSYPFCVLDRGEPLASMSAAGGFVEGLSENMLVARYMLQRYRQGVSP